MGNKTQQLRIRHKGMHLSIRKRLVARLVLGCKTKFHLPKIKDYEKDHFKFPYGFDPFPDLLLKRKLHH
jgi:hypothetical protein